LDRLRIRPADCRTLQSFQRAAENRLSDKHAKNVIDIYIQKRQNERRFNGGLMDEWITNFRMNRWMGYGIDERMRKWIDGWVIILGI